MTAMTLVTDVGGRIYRTCAQKNPVTCGPAACLIMWANANGADPLADEGGVIELSKRFPEPWTPQAGANINNLSRVMAQMGMPNAVQRYPGDMAGFKGALAKHVGERKPVLAFLAWDGTSALTGHFVVIGRANPTTGQITVLDPLFGMQELYGNSLPYYYPTDSDSLTFSGAIAVLT
ncbi:hypothetical protein ACE7GA_17525 [Roseomonas sp. CCTCC AB2023176]|uniref:hypothetical protein n=1 Tax=Roseomonas sp. CCTCC AB2023176 TaxID=3342640 RepID=UPI0035D821FF